MKKLTKNFYFIDEEAHPDIFESVVDIEKKVLGGDYDFLAIAIGKIVEKVFIEELGQQESQGLHNYIDWYKQSYGSTMVVDALYEIKKFRNNGAHYNSYDNKKISWLDAVKLLKSLSYILQEVFFNNIPHDYEFTEMPYLSSTQLQIINNEHNNNNVLSISETELVIKKTSIINWLTNENVIFQIPFYQREYTWNEEQINTLISDIELRIQDRFQHYFGVIAIKKEMEKEEEKYTYKIIDGQQRLTTSILLYKAAFNNLQNRKFKPIKTLNKMFDPKEGKFKSYRYHNNTAKEWGKKELESILSADSWISPDKSDGQYKINYKIFYDYFENQDYPYIQDFIQAFETKFEVAEIEYDISSEREMDIFENMNSKGSQLEEWDLIRNFLLNITDKDIPDIEKIELMNKIFLHNFNSNLKKDESSEIKSAFFTEFFYFKASLNTGLKWVAHKRFPVYNNFKMIYMNKNLSRIEYEKLLKELWAFGQIHKSLVSGDFSILNLKNSSLVIRLKDISRRQQLYFLIFRIVHLTYSLHEDKWQLENFNLFNDLVTIINNFILRREIVSGFAIGQGFRNFLLSLSRLLKNNDSPSKIKEEIRLSPYNTQDFEIKDSLNIMGKKNDLTKTLLMLIDGFLIDKRETQNNNISNEWFLEYVMPKQRGKWEDFLVSQARNSWKTEYEKTLKLIGNFYALPKKLDSRTSNSIFEEKREELLKFTTPMIIGVDEFGLRSLKEIEKWDFGLIRDRSKQITAFLIEKVLSL